MKLDITATPLKPFKAIASNFQRGLTKRDDSNEKKYGPFGWRSTPNPVRAYRAALARHFLEYMDGVFYDDDGVPHLVGIGCNVFILLDLWYQEIEDE